MRFLILAAATVALAGCDPKKEGESKSEVAVNEDTGETVRNMVIQFNDGTLDGMQYGDTVVMKAQGLDDAGNVVAFADGKTESDVTTTSTARYIVRDDKYYADLWRFELLKFQLPAAATKWKIDFSKIPNRTCAPQPTEGAVADVPDVTDKTDGGNNYTIFGNCKIAYAGLSGTAKGIKGDLVIATSDNVKKTLTADGEDVAFEITIEELTAADKRAMTTEEIAAFNAKIPFDHDYTANEAFTLNGEVKVVTNPTGQICTVTNGRKAFESGSQQITSDHKTDFYYVAGPVFLRTYLPAPVTNDVAIVCVDEGADTPTGYSLSVNVTGLTGGTLKLRNNINLDPLDVTADGTHKFSKLIDASAAFDYDVRILAQPAGLTCTLSGDVGTASADVTVTATCAPPVAPTSLTVGGAVSGLLPTDPVTLRMTYGASSTTEDLVVDAAAPMFPETFTFMASLATGTTYSIAVEAQPANTVCTVDAGASGTIGSANVTNVTVGCVTP